MRLEVKSHYSHLKVIHGEKNHDDRLHVCIGPFLDMTLVHVHCRMWEKKTMHNVGRNDS